MFKKVSWFGLIGIALIQSNTIPQTIKILQSGDVKNISIQMFIQTFLGLACFLVHAVKTGDKLYIFSNTIGMVNNAVVITAILLNK